MTRRSLVIIDPSHMLGYARIAIGVIFLARTTPLLLPLHTRFSPNTLLGWPTGAGSGWTAAVMTLALPSVIVAALCIVRTIAAILFMCGVRARAAGVVAAASGYLVLAQDRFAFINSLHILFLATFVLALTTKRKTRTNVEATQTETDADAGDAAIATSSSVRFVSLFLASIYFWAGSAKLQSEWLSGHALEAQLRAGSFAGPIGSWLEHAWIRAGSSWIVPFMELTIAALLVTNRRRVAIALALAFHAVVELTVNPDILGWQMAVLLIAIWPFHKAPAHEAP